MTQQDWFVVISLFVLAITVAYAMGSRTRRPRGSATAPGRATPPKASGEATKAVPPAKAAKASAAKASAPPPPAPAPAEVSALGLARLDYEEDGDIDPTKIGRGPAPKPAVYQAAIKRIVYDEDAATDEPTRAESLFLVSATAQTDTGLRRKRNEDSLLVLESSGVFVVADGMGGYRGGELASQLAVATMAEAYRTNTFEGEPHENVPTHASELARAIQMANSKILEMAKAQRELEGMGTTLCAARFSSNKQRLYIGHVGDSRCYRLRAGTFQQVTADHTMADHGVKGPQSAHLSRAVGIWPTVPIDIVMAVPLPQDIYLLCSDGLTKMLTDEMISDVLTSEEDLNLAVEKLIAAANARGGKDNVTAIIVRVVPPNWQRPKAQDGATATAARQQG